MLRLYRSPLGRGWKLALAVAAGLGAGALMDRPVSSAAAAAPAAQKLDAAQVDFAKDIQPILKESCVRCHKAPERTAAAGGGPGGPGGPGGGRPRGPAGGLRLDDKDAAMKGGKHGKAIVPGKADDSLLYQVLKGKAKAGDDEIDPMPKPKRGEQFKPLAEDKIALIKAWIDQGAKWGN